MAASEVSAAAEQNVEAIPPPKQSTADKFLTALTLIRLAFVGAWKHYTVGPPAPTWPLFVSIVTYLIRTSATTATRKRTANPPRTRAELVGLAQVKSTLDKFVVDKDALEDAIVKEVEFTVKKRPELGGLLQECAAQETGDRKLKAEWTVHDSLLPSCTTKGRTTPRPQVVLYLHGGAHVRLSPRTHRRTVARISQEFKCRALSLDYRLSPGVVFPASTLDAVSAYFYLTEDLGIAPEEIIVAGDSAGGGLCLTLMQYLRDAGLPQVGAAYLLSPWCDLTTSFESWNRNKDHDYIKIDDENDPMHPPRLYLSPVYPRTPASDADYNRLLVSGYVSQALAPLEALRDLPPMLVQTGGLETLVDENVVLVRRLRLAGGNEGKVTHQVWMDGVHVFQALQPDRAGASALREAGKWYARLRSSSSATATNSKDADGGWTRQIDDLIEEEKQARIARTGGPLKRAKKPAADPKWEYVRSVERVQPEMACKVGAAHEEVARKAAEEARRIEGERAESEVFRPVRAGSC